MKEIIQTEVKELYHNIDLVINDIIKGRAEHNDVLIANAQHKMESLMVQTQQMLSCICDSLPEETSEDLEEAAKQYAKYTAAPPSDVAYHFVAGVSWQRNRVWHDIDEKPNMRKFVVFSDGKKSMTPPMRNPFEDFPMLIDVANRKYGGGYKVWAYAEDLLPNMEGEK